MRPGKEGVIIEGWLLIELGGGQEVGGGENGLQSYAGASGQRKAACACASAGGVRSQLIFGH